MRALAEEQASGTMEVLSTFPVRPWQIVVGKYLAALGFLGVAILLTLPYAFTAAGLGDLDWGATMAGYLGLFLSAALYAAMGVFASALSPNQIVGAVVGVLMTFAVFIMGELLQYVPAWAVGLVEYGSVGYHLDGLARGVVDSRNVLYFLSQTGFWLAAAGAIIDWRRLPSGSDLLGRKGHVVPLVAGVTAALVVLFVGAGIASGTIGGGAGGTTDVVPTAAAATLDGAGAGPGPAGGPAGGPVGAPGGAAPPAASPGAGPGAAPGSPGAPALPPGMAPASAGPGGSAAPSSAKPKPPVDLEHQASPFAMLLVFLAAGAAFVLTVAVLRRTMTGDARKDPAVSRWLAVRRESATFLTLLVAITLALNFVASRAYGRLDWTESDENTLSPASRALVSALPDRMFVTAYFDKDIPPPFNNHERFVRDLLEEYAAVSNGRFRFTFIAPGDDKDLQAEARKAGVQENQVQVLKSDKLEVAKVFMGLVFHYGGQTEAWVPTEADYSSLEYELSGIITRLTKPKKTIGFLSGHGEPNLFTNMKNVKEGLGHFVTRPIDLSEGKKVPEGTDALFVIGPKSRLSEREKFEIDQFIMAGHAVAFLYEGMGIEPKNKLGTALDVGLDDVMAHYGASARHDTVMDENAEIIRIPTTRGMAILQYPPIPRVTELSKTHTITAGGGMMSLPFASSILVNDTARARAGTNVEVVAMSGPKSWRREGFMLFDPTKAPALRKGDTDDAGPFVLGAAITGTIPSFYAGKPIPRPTKKASPPEPGMPPMPPEEMPPLPEDATRAVTASTADGRVFVFGDGDFMLDPYLSRTNLAVALNLADWMARDPGLTSIRTKSVNARPLKETEPATKETLKWTHRLGLAAGLIVFGLLRWRWREVRRRNIRIGAEEARS